MVQDLPGDYSRRDLVWIQLERVCIDSGSVGDHGVWDWVGYKMTEGNLGVDSGFDGSFQMDKWVVGELELVLVEGVVGIE